MPADIVFTPLKIGNIELKNRIVRAAHTSPGTGPVYDEKAIAYHAARAKFGCAMTVLGSSSVHRSSVVGKYIFDDAIIKNFEQLMAVCRPHGMRMVQQLYHAGNIRTGLDGQPPWAVSDRPGYSGYVGVPMEDAQILELIQAFAQAAQRCAAGGLDGVEIHAAHGYLPQQFLSRNLNTREDRWGGDFAGRTRFLLEVLRAIRKAAPELVLGVRLSVPEAPDDITPEDNIALIRLMCGESLIDYLNVSKGSYYRFDTMLSGMHSPTGYELSATAPVAAAANVPRMLTGRFRTLEEAGQVIRAGEAEMISMVRALIADPELIAKTRAGKVEQVRPCIACNQGCYASVARAEGLGCTVNPAAGYEALYAEELITKAVAPKKILIIGGGPAGLEAARVAALAGHKVVLAEAAPKLGGAVNIAQKAPKLGTIGDIVFWLEQEVYRLGVEVRLSSYMEAEDVKAEAADTVLIATGAVPRMDGFQFQNPGIRILGTAQNHVASAADIIAGTAKPGATALVMDSVGHYECIAVLETLLELGVSTTFVTHHRSLAPFIETSERDVPALERMHRIAAYGPVTAGRNTGKPQFEILSRHWLHEIRERTCLVKPSYADDTALREIAAETVVLMTPKKPERSLYDSLRPELQDNIKLIGDAYAPRDLQKAIAHGHRTARQL